jgi:hypothetical protein
MADQPTPDTPSAAEVRARLHEVARRLNTSRHLDPDTRRTLAELVDELSRLLESAQVPPAEVARLAESTAHLAESLHHRHDQGLLGSARSGFEQAVASAQAHAPFATGLARRLLEALANLGI